VTGLVEFLSIAWPGLLVLAGYVALIAHAARAHHRRQHPRGRYRVTFTGPRGELLLEAQHELTEGEARDVAALAHGLVGRTALVDAMTSAHSRGLHRGEHTDPDCFHCAVRDGTAARWPG
jgi:hypothetical protein